MTKDTTPESVERLKGEVMTLEHNGGIWVTAEDYGAVCAERDALNETCVTWSEVSQRNYQRAKAAEAERDALKAELVDAEKVMRAADKALCDHGLPHDGQSRGGMRAFLARHQKEIDT